MEANDQGVRHVRHENPPVVDMAFIAQDIYDDSFKATFFDGELRSKVVDRYERTGLREFRPDQASYLELRTAWNALLAPMLHTIELAITEDALEFMKEGVPFTEVVAEVAPASKALDKFLTKTYTGAQLTFMRTMGIWTSACALKFIQNIEEDSPDHYFHTVWRMFQNLHEPFCVAETKQTGIKRLRDPVDAILEMTLDANETVLAVLTAAQQHFPVWGDGWTKNKKQAFLTIAEELSWPSTLKRNVVANYLGRRAAAKTCPFAHDNPHSLGDRNNFWRHIPIKDGPQDPSGFCPAAILLRSPLQYGKELVENLYRCLREDCERPRYWVRRPYGMASSAQLRTIVASYVGGQIL